MAWPPSTHQDVEDEVTSLRDRMRAVGADATVVDANLADEAGIYYCSGTNLPSGWTDAQLIVGAFNADYFSQLALHTRDNRIARRTRYLNVSTPVWSSWEVLPSAHGATAGRFLRATSATATEWKELLLDDLPQAWTKRSARVATTAALGVTASTSTTLTIPSTAAIDGVTLANGDRILVKDEPSATAYRNGIYTRTSATLLTRASDANDADKLNGAVINIETGTQGGRLFKTGFKLTDTLGTTSVLWTELGGSALSYVTTEYAEALWGNTSIANNATGTTTVFVPAVARASANLTEVKWVINAQSQGNVNQALNYYLEVSFDGGTVWDVIDRTYQHNNGGLAPDIGTTLVGWVPHAPGASLRFRVRIVVGGGGAAVNFGQTTVRATFFQTSTDGNPVDTGWIAPALGSGVTNAFANTYPPAGYRKIGNVVYLRGLINFASATAQQTAFTLPPGFRPAYHLHQATAHNSGFSIVNVFSTGEVKNNVAVTTGAWFSLDGVSFPVG